MLIIPRKLAPKLRENLNLFDEEKNKSVWVERKTKFYIASKEQMLINLCYNPNKTIFIDFLEKLTINIDNTFTVSNKITLIADYNKNYLNISFFCWSKIISALLARGRVDQPSEFVAGVQYTLIGTWHTLTSCRFATCSISASYTIPSIGRNSLKNSG